MLVPPLLRAAAQLVPAMSCASGGMGSTQRLLLCLSRGGLVGVPGREATGSSPASPASCFQETLTAAAAFCSSASTCASNSSRVWTDETC